MYIMSPMQVLAYQNDGSKCGITIISRILAASLGPTVPPPSSPPDPHSYLWISSKRRVIHWLNGVSGRSHPALLQKYIPLSLYPL